MIMASIDSYLFISQCSLPKKSMCWSAEYIMSVIQFSMCLSVFCRHEEGREQSRGSDSLPQAAGISHSFGRSPCQDEVWYTVLHHMDLFSLWLVRFSGTVEIVDVEEAKRLGLL